MAWHAEFAQLFFIDEQLREVRLSELSTFLKHQDYPDKLIEDGIEKAKLLTVEQLRTPRPKNKKDIIPFVHTHNPCISNIYNVIKSNVPILMESENMSGKLTKNSIIDSKRQPRNLKQILTKAKFRSGSNTEGNKEVKICGDPRCGICSKDN